MSYNHQPQLSVNSVQSVIEPVTPPPIGQMNNKKNHQKTQSLDLSTFNHFIASSSSSSSSSSGSSNNVLNSHSPMLSNNNNNNLIFSPKIGNDSRDGNKNLPLIAEFDNYNNNKYHSSSNQRGNTTATNTTGGGRHNNGQNKKSKASGKYHHNNSKHNHNNNGNSKNKYNGNGNGNGNGNSSSSLLSSSNSVTPLSIDDINSTSLEDLDYVKLATDQFGCRFLQKKLESNSSNESDLVRDLMFDQIKPYFINLILDPFGNYLIQKLCEYLTIEQRTTLINSIYPYVFKISINQYGTRSLQKIIDTVDNESQIDLIVKGFSTSYTSIDQIVVLINDLNGNHVIQKCIFKFPSTKFDFIINAIIEKNNIITISTHKHGCCVLQKLLSVCTLQQIYTISINIIQFLPGLINDQFGNYIIQFLLDIRDLDFYFLVETFNKLSGDLCQLSCLKFSSNVIEKFIKKLFGAVIGAVKGEAHPNMTDEVMNNIMNILLTIIDIFTMKLNILIRDNFGNYALQTLLDSKNYSIMLEYNGNDYILKNNPKFLNFSHDFTTKVDILIRLTKDLLPSIKTTSYAKKIKLKVKGYAELCNIDFSEPAQAVSNLSGSKDNNNNTLVTTSQNSSLLIPDNQRKQHQRHVSLPANAYHRRNSSNVLSVNSAFAPLSSQQQQPLSSIQTSITNIFNSQNSSPLSINQPQQMEYLSEQPFMPFAANTIMANSGLTVPNDLNYDEDFNLAKPLANLTLNSGVTSSQPLFFMNELGPTSNSNRNVSTSSSSSNLLQNNSYSSTSSATVNSSNPNNNFMTAPTLMNTLSIAYNPNDRNNSSNFNDFKHMALQPQQRIISNPFPNQSFQTMNTNQGTTSNATSQIYNSNTNNGTLLGGINNIPNINGTDNFNDSFGYY
ncbi:similar to Saccharomyces cerevisiae YGL178W MPT5 Member of the Puf family of RNA-binding proteins [Maudiozyma saulgeensis]|uniref:Similar to Saccharomyces cerevisiae YGL178W MPT5 Member of the Puf family of RNA-binding proteins n=1 Tax=Maudiozyma saulgeensis TaxID=1789683 RepID=A0A1X7QYK4_9SACH|nr:similar to Saccharomyces cerevisiae YGL178W MPT5 Member of the Puf family of RNA-binding proteins [Kazachstania saulgeensis]